MSWTVPGRLRDADGLAAVLSWLSGHADLADTLGGPGHVSGVLEAPWPRIVVVNGPGGDLGLMRWATRQEVNLEVYGDPDGRPGKAALWRMAMAAVDAVVEMPDSQPVGDGLPVVSAVDSNGAVAWSPLPSGQHRWIVSFFLTVHPPPLVPVS